MDHTSTVLGVAYGLCLVAAFIVGFFLGGYALNRWWKDHGHLESGPCKPQVRP